MNERRFPCLVVDITGQTLASIKLRDDSSKGDPKWECKKESCIIRTKFLKRKVGAAYKPPQVEINTFRGVRGVVTCQGGGIANYKLPIT